MIEHPIYICSQAQEYCLSKWHCSRLIARAESPGEIHKHLCPFISKVVDYRQLALVEITDDHVIVIPYTSKHILINAIPK